MSLHLTFDRLSFAHNFWCNKFLTFGGEQEPVYFFSMFHDFGAMRFDHWIFVRQSHIDPSSVPRTQWGLMGLCFSAFALICSSNEAFVSQDAPALLSKTMQILFVGLLQRLAILAVQLVIDLSFLWKNAFERSSTDVFQQLLLLRASSFGERKRRTVGVGSLCATLFIFSGFWSLVCETVSSNYRLIVTLFLVFYEIVPLVSYWHRHRHQKPLPKTRIVALCIQALVFLKINNLLLPSESPFWFLSAFIHLLVPIALHIGDIECKFF